MVHLGCLQVLRQTESEIEEDVHREAKNGDQKQEREDAHSGKERPRKEHVAVDARVEHDSPENDKAEGYDEEGDHSPARLLADGHETKHQPWDSQEDEDKKDGFIYNHVTCNVSDATEE